MMNLRKSGQQLSWNLWWIINSVITQFYRIKTNWVVTKMYINYSVQWFNDLICGLKGYHLYPLSNCFSSIFKNDIAVGRTQIRLNEILVTCWRRAWQIRNRWLRSWTVTPLIWTVTPLITARLRIFQKRKENENGLRIFQKRKGNENRLRIF